MIAWISQLVIPLTIIYMVGFGLLSHRPVFDDFLAGARQGMRTVTEILPTLIGLMTAVGVVRASGLLDVIGSVLKVPAAGIHFPTELIPLTLVRLISHSAAVSLMLDLFKQYGPDSRLGMIASVLLSSTETVFYCLSVYLGAVSIKKTRYIIPGAMVATLAGILAAVLVV